MELPRLHGIVPPLPTPLAPDESIDLSAVERVGRVRHHAAAFTASGSWGRQLDLT